MSSRSQAILKEIKALSPAEQRDVCSHVMEWFQSNRQPKEGIETRRFGRGMLAGQGLNQALMRYRQEEHMLPPK